MGAVEDQGRVDAPGVGRIHVDETIGFSLQPVQEVADDVRAKMTFHLVSHMDEVLRLALK